MKTIIIKVNSAKETIATYSEVVRDGKVTHIKARSNVQYDFIEKNSGYAPENIATKRVGNDLHISFEGSDIDTPDVIIDGYYSQTAESVVGRAEDGLYYHYVPESANSADAISTLDSGDAAGQALGGEGSETGLWSEGFSALGLLAGAAGLGAIAAAAGGGGGSDAPPTQPEVTTVLHDSPAPPPPIDHELGIEIQEDFDNDGIISSLELYGQVDVLINIPDTVQVGDTLIITNPDGSTTDVTVTQDMIDFGYYVAYDAPDDGETITVSATITDTNGHTSPVVSDSAIIDTTATDAPTVTITEDTNNDGLLSASEMDGDTDIQIDIPEDAEVGDILNVTIGETVTDDGVTTEAVTTNVTITQDMIDNGYTTSVPPPEDGETLNVSATITDVAGNVSDTSSDSAVIDTTAPTVDNQTFSYAENQVADATVGTLATNADVATYEFANGTQTSADGFYAIDNSGNITITTAGAESAVNDFETAPNTGNYDVIAKDTAGNPTTITVTLNETNLNDNAPVAVDDAITVTEDTVFTSTIDLDANDTDLDGDALSVTAGTFTTAQGGTLVLASDGSYTYTPADNFNGTDTVDYTVTDGTDTDVGTLTITVDAVNDAPITDIDSYSITEGSVLNATTVLANDSDADVGDTISVVNIASDSSGTNMVNADGSTTLTTAQGGTVVMNSNGTFTYTAPVLDHAADGLVEQDYIYYKASDGTNDSSWTKVTLNVEDDVPVGENIIQNIEQTTQDQTTNLVIVLDRSGSMGYSAGNGETRMSLAQDALKSLFDAYDNIGNVNIKIVDFSSNVNESSWYVNNVAGAEAYVDSINANGGTYYDAALNAVINGYNPPTADKTLVYFISDGEPNSGYEVDTTLEANWESFLNSNNIDISYGIGIGSGVSLNDLYPIAYPDAGSNEPYAINVLQASDMEATLLATVNVAIVTGDTVTTNGSESGIILGADDGHIDSIEVDGVTHTYDSSTNTTETITTSLGGEIFINYETGEYQYTFNSTDPIPANQEVFEITAIDGDGDTKSIDLIININYDIVNGTNGDDTLAGIDGLAEVLSAGEGDDVIHLSEVSDIVDGGVGIDTLLVSNDITMDFSTLEHNINNIEYIDLTSANVALNNISVEDVLDMTDSSNTLTIMGESGDTVTLDNSVGGAWVQEASTTTISGHTYDVYHNNDADLATLYVESAII
ncbi:T1SS secreted agglutinin RTX [hydrothermal vent metagenome]|uniref:T1SS secreted agglutinin RTX n=1 Tax=hydrothermal vent metagenome TaxID=652676 RepID=A0A1W1EE87_9ZZZZ